MLIVVAMWSKTPSPLSKQDQSLPAKCKGQSETLISGAMYDFYSIKESMTVKRVELKRQVNTQVQRTKQFRDHRKRVYFINKRFTHKLTICNHLFTLMSLDFLLWNIKGDI